MQSQPDCVDRVAQAHWEIQRLYDLTQDVGNSLSLSETLSVAGIRLQEIVPHDCIAVYVRDQDRLRPVFVQGENARLFGALEIRLGAGLSGRVESTGEPVFNGDPLHEFAGLEDVPAVSLKSALVLPLIGSRGLRASLALYRLEANAFEPAHLRLLQAIQSKLAHAVENAWNFQRVEANSTLDTLTSLPNARALFLQLDRELSRCRRTRESLVVLACDLEGLRGINERFGTLRGDAVLQEIARQMTEACREYDFVARMGGDEFVVVLPAFPPEHVARKKESLIAAARHACDRVCGESFLKLSIGHAVFPGDGNDAEELLAKAESRLLARDTQPASH
ncbi:MAG: sensor domain-containing diguanylate cyclase [Bryobacteraceae bacterium]